MPEKTSTRREYHRRYLAFLLFLVVLYVLEALALLELIRGQAVQDQRLRILMTAVLVVAVVLETHYFIKVAEKAGRFEEKCRRTHSFPPHLCHDDPETVPIIRGRTLPMCSRHFGFYLALGISGLLTILLTFEFWLQLIDKVGVPIYVGLTIVFVAAVPVHGALTRLLGWKEQKTLRFVAGFLHGLSWFFLATLLLKVVI